jgi:hypothetical protein
MTMFAALPALTPAEAGLLLALLLGAILLYLAYKIFYKPDFGLPVRRRVFCSHMRVDRDQVAYVPIWWSNLQVQGAIKKHWKQSLEQTFRGHGKAASR